MLEEGNPESKKVRLLYQQHCSESKKVAKIELKL